jgi:hypothetical protein
MPWSATFRKVSFVLIAGPLLALTMGQGCPVPFPPGRNVVVLLVNDSGDWVDPVLYAAPGTVFVPADIMRPQNRVNIGGAMSPGEIVTVTLRCGEAGSLLADADVVEFADGTLASAGLLREGEHYFCGEMVTFYYDPLPPPGPVTVELVNLTSNPVDALLWADPDLWFAAEDVSIPQNFIDIGPPLVPGDVVTVTLDCLDAGTLLADGDLLVVGGAITSANLILLREGEHFLCGDIVSFYYEIDGVGGFFISADVNDINIAP